MVTTHFDTYFDKFGHFTAYQARVTICICMMASWIIPSVSINYVAGPMKHWCDLSHVPGNYSESELKNMYIPMDKDGNRDSCYMYKFPPNNSLSNNVTDDSEKTPCVKWDYDQSDFTSTIVSKYGLVCEREWLIAFAASVMGIGFTAGSLLCGFLADRFGRLRILMFHMVFQAAGGFGGIIAPNYTLFAFSRLLVGFGNGGTWICGLVLMVEEVGPRWRSTVTVGMQFAFSVGFCLMSAVAYLIHTTEYFQLALALPTLIYFSYGWILVESPRWLIVVKQYKRAQATMKRFFPKKYQSEIARLDYSAVQAKGDSSKKGNWLSLCRSKKLAVGTAVIHYCWIAASLMWYALSLNTAALKGNIFLVTFLMGFVEIPAGLTCMVLCRWRVTGRKKTGLGSLLAAGICGFTCVPLLQKNYLIAVTTISLLGKFFASIAWSSVYVFSAELYPTEVRNSAIGSSAFCSYITGIMGSFVGGPMRNVWPPMPYIIYGVVGMSAAVFGLYLPETFGKHLCETVEEAEKYKFVMDKNLIVEQDVDLPLKEKEEISESTSTVTGQACPPVAITR